MSGNDGIQFKSFVSENEIEEKKKQRQEEWEKVRKPSDPEQAPEEVYDHRSLFERLQEQKDKKQAEYEEAHKLRNQVKGLEDDEVAFLDFVNNKQEELSKQRENEDSQVLQEYQNALVVDRTKDAPSGDTKPRKTLVDQMKGKKSQLSLLAGAVKRKSVDTSQDIDPKKPKTACPATSQQSVAQLPVDDDEDDEDCDDDEDSVEGSLDGEISNHNSPCIPSTAMQTAQVLGVLPGMGCYSESSDSDENSSDSDNISTDLFGKRCGKVHQQ